MIRNAFFCLVASVISLSVRSQAITTDTAKAVAAASAPALTVTGSADLYYRYDLNRQSNAYTSFAQTHNQFALGMASVKFEHKTAKVDMVADLGFGKRAKDFAYTDDGITQAVKQLYISYSPNAWLKLTGGTWATHIGYEVLDAYANRNYSMSYMFSYGPFSHTGFKADLAFGKSSLMVGVSNPTDFRIIPDSLKSNKNLIAQYGYAASDNFKFYLNYVGGKNAFDDKVHQYDLVINAKASSIFGIGFNATVNKSSLASEDYANSYTFWGSAIYLNLDPKPWFGLTLREEYFKYTDDTKVFASTLSANFKVDGFTFIPEFRLDNASREIFSKHDLSGTKTDPSFLIACVYSF